MDDEAYKAVAKIKTIFYSGHTPAVLIEGYNKWAEEYEKDIAAIGYKVQWPTAEALLKNMSNSSLQSGKIIDIACGSGLVGEALRTSGFKGVLHGTDGSEKMMALARGRGCYDELVLQMMYPDKAIETPTKYDGLTCVGAFTTNHLPAKIIPRFVDLMVVGGVLAFSIRDSVDNAVLLQQLKDEIEVLKTCRKVEEICVVETNYDVDWNVESCPSEKQRNSTLHIFVLRRL